MICKNWKVKGSKNQEYELTMKFLIEKKLIYFIDCTCWNFKNRRIKESGEFADRKFYSEPCKHLKPYVDFYEKTKGFKLKVPKKMEGTDKCTVPLRNALILRSGGTCEAFSFGKQCQQPGKHVHRKIRGSNGGKYNKTNCVYLCEGCHKQIHSNEFSGVKG